MKQLTREQKDKLFELYEEFCSDDKGNYKNMGDICSITTEMKDELDFYLNSYEVE